MSGKLPLSNFVLFRPILAGAQPRERIVAALGAAACMVVTILLCALAPHGATDLPIIVAPIGASAVLAFAVPSSPLAQPWSVVGGNVLSTLVGVAAFQAIPNVAVAAGVAVGAAIVVMSLLRCLHPPGGAAALTAVIGGDAVHQAGYAFAFAPVALNSIALVLIALVFHRLAGRSYPHRVRWSPAEARAAQAIGFHEADIDAALADMHESFDISREDLDLLLTKAELHAARRHANR